MAFEIKVSDFVLSFWLRVAWEREGHVYRYRDLDMVSMGVETQAKDVAA